jgi:hypothetical protein
MSRASDRIPDLPPTRELSPDQQADRAKYSPIPNIKGIGGGVDYVLKAFNVEVTDSYLRRAVSQRRLERHEICHVIHFSERDLYDFIVLGTRKNDDSSKVSA